MKIHYVEFIDFDESINSVLFISAFGHYELPSPEYLTELKTRLEHTIEHYDAITQWCKKKNVTIDEEDREKQKEWSKERKDKWRGTARYIYLLKNADRNIFKIGVSQNPKVRMRQLQIATTDKLELIGFKRGSYELEKQLHDKYSHLNLSGEWFSPCTELINEFKGTDL